MEKKEKLEVESFEDEAQIAREEAIKVLFSAFLPPKEVREEVLRQMKISEMAFWKALKTIIDYKVQKLEKQTEPKQETKRKAKKIEIE